MASDLKKCNLSGIWKEHAQEHDSWCTTIQQSVERLNIEAENNKKSCKDEKKCHCEQRLIDSETALQPPWLLFPGPDQPSASTSFHNSKDSVPVLPSYVQPAGAS